MAANIKMPKSQLKEEIINDEKRRIRGERRLRAAAECESEENGGYRNVA